MKLKMFLLAGGLSLAAVIAVAAPASAYVVCNPAGDCWHTDRRVAVPGVTSPIILTTGTSTSIGMPTITFVNIMKVAAIGGRHLGHALIPILASGARGFARGRFAVSDAG